ncbi:hypothetical protein CVT26_014764 [Gymnopilus dilepis]|uniref:Uncharacterized protein n=1 Tax=Gymnopilus dilepis TaxID=231916 RepID=A0A409YXN3_9AGAR|nr:hypothetical protein CVT26_014764 [Gymnopilus dilepis]
MGPELAGPFESSMVATTIGATSGVGAGLTSRGWRHRRIRLRVPAAAARVLTVLVLSMRARATSAFGLRSPTCNRGVAPPPAALAEGDTRVGARCLNDKAAVAKHERLSYESLRAGPGLRVPDVEVGRSSCAGLRVVDDPDRTVKVKVGGEGRALHQGCLHLLGGGPRIIVLPIARLPAIVGDITNAKIRR